MRYAVPVYMTRRAVCRFTVWSAQKIVFHGLGGTAYPVVWFAGRGGVVTLPRAAAFVDDADVALEFCAVALESLTAATMDEDTRQYALREFVSSGGLDVALALCNACPRFGVVFARCLALDCNVLTVAMQRHHSGGATSLLHILAKFASSQLLRAAVLAAKATVETVVPETVVLGPHVAALLAGAIAMPQSGSLEGGLDIAQCIISLVLGLPWCFAVPANASAFAKAGIADYLSAAWELASSSVAALCDVVKCILALAKSDSGMAAIVGHRTLSRLVLEAVLLYAADAMICAPACELVVRLARAPEAAAIWLEASVPAAVVAGVAAGHLSASQLASEYASVVAPAVASSSLYAWATARGLGAALPSLAALGAATVADLSALSSEDIDGAALPVVLSRRLKAALGFAGSSAEPGPAKMEIGFLDLSFEGGSKAASAGGHFSEVVRARWKRRTVVAVKTLKAYDRGDGRAGVEAVHELSVMSRLWNHEVGVPGWCSGGGRYY